MNKENWDDISSNYDQSVENNTDPVIANYLEQEMSIVGSLCKNIMQKTRKKCSIVDMGSGTGRVLFSLDKILDDLSVLFYGIDNSEHMISRANKKQLASNPENKNIKFFMSDLTDPKSFDLIPNDTVNIVMCLYNTIGVIPSEKRNIFFDNMVQLAGNNGLVIVSAFNGDNFKFAAPALYLPMKKMVKQIDSDSFDESNLIFQNKLGYHSQWFKQDELHELLKSNERPTPICVKIDGADHVLGNVFTNHRAN